MQVLGPGKLVGHIVALNWRLRDHWERLVLLGGVGSGLSALERVLNDLVPSSFLVVV